MILFKKFTGIILATMMIILLLPINQALAATDLTVKYAPETFNRPEALAMAGDGGFFVCDKYNNRIVKYTADGSVDKSFVSDGILGGVEGSGADELDSPMDICVDSVGNIYVVDTSNKRIIKFTASGVRDLAFDGDGIVDGFKNGSGIFQEFSSSLYGIATDDEHLYVTDKIENKILKYDASTGVQDESFLMLF